MSVAAPADLVGRLDTARDLIAARVRLQPRIGLILGSGLGAMAETLDDAAVIPYGDIPGWPISTVPGHSGRLVIGKCEGVPLAVMQGRVHPYEGYAPWEVAFPTRVLALLGCQALLLTNAAGAVNAEFSPGDLMLITDHINLQGSNPCVGPNLHSLGERFFDMSQVYDPAYIEAGRMAALGRGQTLREGVYAAMLGPSFETPAEIRMLRTLGADAVGMSTVPEAIAAIHAGLKVAGLSCITNMAAGILDQPLSHTEVMEVGERVRDDLIGLLRGTIHGIAELENWIGADG
ncbi:MAG TPA: purine-nucleoside phosphorylase [Acidobacteriota bacterium]|nr:purine-nucleoside phosphorylase [Acidobacteriota bacterium]